MASVPKGPLYWRHGPQEKSTEKWHRTFKDLVISSYFTEICLQRRQNSVLLSVLLAEEVPTQVPVMICRHPPHIKHLILGSETPKLQAK